MKNIKKDLLEEIASVFEEGVDISVAEQVTDEYKVRISWQEYSLKFDKVRPANPVIIIFQKDVLEDLVHLSEQEFNIYRLRLNRFIQSELSKYQAGIDRDPYVTVEPFRINVLTIL